MALDWGYPFLNLVNRFLRFLNDVMSCFDQAAQFDKSVSRFSKSSLFAIVCVANARPFITMTHVGR
eukprot:594434-Pyramimonas_sp.AAC.1